MDDPTALHAHSQRASAIRRTGPSPMLLLFALVASTVFIAQLSVGNGVRIGDTLFPAPSAGTGAADAPSPPVADTGARSTVLRPRSPPARLQPTRGLQHSRAQRHRASELLAYEEALVMQAWAGETLREERCFSLCSEAGLALMSAPASAPPLRRYGTTRHGATALSVVDRHGNNVRSGASGVPIPGDPAGPPRRRHWRARINSNSSTRATIAAACSDATSGSRRHFEHDCTTALRPARQRRPHRRSGRSGAECRYRRRRRAGPTDGAGAPTRPRSGAASVATRRTRVRRHNGRRALGPGCILPRLATSHGHGTRTGTAIRPGASPVRAPAPSSAALAPTLVPPYGARDNVESRPVRQVQPAYGVLNANGSLPTTHTEGSTLDSIEWHNQFNAPWYWTDAAALTSAEAGRLRPQLDPRPAARRPREDRPRGAATGPRGDDPDARAADLIRANIVVRKHAETRNTLAERHVLCRQLHVHGAGPGERRRLLLLRMPYHQHARPGKWPGRPLRPDNRRGHPCGRTRTSANANADANAVAYAATTCHSASALRCPLQCQRRRQCRGRSECWRPFRTRASPEPACSSPTAGYESPASRARTTLAWTQSRTRVRKPGHGGCIRCVRPPH